MSVSITTESGAGKFGKISWTIRMRFPLDLDSRTALVANLSHIGSENTNKKVALVHQYLRPDGRIGASGMPDPKWLLGEGEILVPEELAHRK